MDTTRIRRRQRISCMGGSSGSTSSMSMMRDSMALACAAIAVFGCGGSDGPSGPAEPGGDTGSDTASIRLLREDAIHGYFHPSGDELVLDVLGPDTYYDVASVDLEGNTLREYTAGAAGIHQRHNGWPTWSPDGEYIVFQSEEPQHYLDAFPALGMPGLGLFNNLWATKADGSAPTQLTDIPIKLTQTDGIPVQGVVHPVFSHDGSTLMWTERYDNGGTNEWGMWRVRVARFVVAEEGPSLADVRTLIDGQEHCASCNYVIGMTFSPDDESVLVAGNLSGQHPYGMDLYHVDVGSGEVTSLLDTPTLWEEGSCWSPDGSAIVYMTNAGSEYELDFDEEWVTQPITRELWVMNADGTGKRQLTRFNEPGSAEYESIGRGRRVSVGHCSFSPDGRSLAVVVTVDESDGPTVSNRIHLGLIQLE